MMRKFVVGIVLVAFTSLCGYFLARKYRQRKLFFTELQEFNERFLSEIAYYRRPLREFAAKYAYKGAFGELLEKYFLRLETDGNTVGKTLDSAEFSFLKADEKHIVEDYFSMLGKGDSASQKGYFSSVKTRLTQLRTEAETTCKRYADLYVKLGFLFGLLILILML